MPESSPAIWSQIHVYVVFVGPTFILTSVFKVKKKKQKQPQKQRPISGTYDVEMQQKKEFWKKKSNHWQWTRRLHRDLRSNSTCCPFFPIYDENHCIVRGRGGGGATCRFQQLIYITLRFLLVHSSSESARSVSVSFWTPWVAIPVMSWISSDWNFGIDYLGAEDGLILIKYKTLVFN